MTPAEVLDDAADYIEEHGWCQGSLFSQTGSVCAEGALRKASGLRLSQPMGDNGVAHQAWDSLHRFIGRNIPTWNDDDTTTEELVTKTMRACAADLRGTQ